MFVGQGEGSNSSERTCGCLNCFHRAKKHVYKPHLASCSAQFHVVTFATLSKGPSLSNSLYPPCTKLSLLCTPAFPQNKHLLKAYHSYSTIKALSTCHYNCSSILRAYEYFLCEMTRYRCRSTGCIHFCHVYRDRDRDRESVCVRESEARMLLCEFISDNYN
jgi:hypothetical protein